MPGLSSTRRQAIADQNARIMALFEAAGHKHIAPEVIQPADVFLERAGEDIRQRTFVFTDPDGHEVCLRPDLTVPTCRYHLEHAADPATEARYAYDGLAFRHAGPRSTAPREQIQIGLEWFGAGDAELAESEIFNLTCSAMAAAGLESYRIRLGDLGLFHALLDSIDMPERWRRRLAHEFWRPMSFHRLLSQLTGRRKTRATTATPLARKIATQGVEKALDVVETTLEGEGLALVPGRTAHDIARRLEEKARDISAPVLDPEVADTINAYLDSHGSLASVASLFDPVAASHGQPFADAVKAMQRRHQLLEPGAGAEETVFAAGYGRALEYYTGFVFQIEVDDVDGGPLVVAGGGRYDSLLSDIGGCDPVPAVGCAIFAERLLSAVERQPS